MEPAARFRQLFFQQSSVQVVSLIAKSLQMFHRSPPSVGNPSINPYYGIGRYCNL